MTDENPLRALFRIPNFWLFLFSRAGTVFGTSILSVAVGWHIYQITGNVLDLGLVGLFQFAPMLALFLVSGWVADQVDRRWILGLCNFIDVAATLAIGVYLLAGNTVIWPVFLMLSLHGAARSFTHPAQQALLPNLVPEKLFPNAMAVATSVLKLGMLGGPAVAGVLIALIDFNTYFVSAACFVIAAVASLALRGDFKVKGAEPFGLAMLFGGFTHVWREKIVLASISIDLVAVLFGSVVGLLPVFAADILNVGPEWLGILRAGPGIGALVMAIYFARVDPDWHMGRMFVIALVIFSGSILVFAFSTSVWLSLAALVIYGGSDMLSVYIRMTLVQLRTPDALRGRVSAVNTIAINASNELGDFRAGTMAAFIGAVPAVAVGGAMTLGASLLWWGIFPQLRKLRRLSSD